MRVLSLPLRLLFTAATLLLLATSGRAAGAENLVTCNELPRQPTDGVHVNGVLFYTYGEGGGEGNGESGGAPLPPASYYGASGPGLGAYVQDPSIITDNYFQYTVVGMEFDVPTTNLQFGLALSDFGNFPQGAFVDLYDANENYLQTITISASPVVTYPEALFNYSGAPVKWAEVYTADEIESYAIDNIRFGNLVNRTQGIGEGTTPSFMGSRFAAVLNARATAPTRGTGSFTLVASGREPGSLRSTQFNTVMLFGNRAVVTGIAMLKGQGLVRFVVEVVDGGTRAGADRISVAIYPLNGEGEGDNTLGPLPIATGNFRVL